jgi:hypothetical protein
MISDRVCAWSFSWLTCRYVNLAYESERAAQVETLAAVLVKQFGHVNASCPPNGQLMRP